ncbi:hypothetical protein [Dactylosporangium sp. NPDC051541]|uniref:hypothetical protein n=1 Tax=Dactylosporangium sp. NPDC051541 TaxID=3363977 RepID=UPI0037B0B832
MVEFYPIAVGHYDQHPALDADSEADAVHEVLTPFGSRLTPWLTRSDDRGGDAVTARLLEWAYRPDSVNTVLYWVGHGWSDGLEAALAHARSPRTVRAFGVGPEQLAEAARTRQATAEGHWALVVIEACWSSRFVDRLNALLAEGPVGADAVMLVGVSADGAVPIGRFRSALQACLQENFRSNRRIELWRLVGELDRRLAGGLVIGRRLGSAALERATTPIAATVSVPLDMLRLLEDAVNQLSADERRHFLAKAQAAEEGEVSWFFQGRDEETRVISEWLRSTHSGLFVVTGPAGSGKSALLGHALVHSLPELRDALILAGLIEPLRGADDPPENAFDLVIHLAGMSVAGCVIRIANGAGLGPVPTAGQDGGSAIDVAGDIAWLLGALLSRTGSFTVLADALDEALDPVAMAGSLLRPLARLDNVRVVVGTRASTRESPDFPAGTDRNLLDALGVQAGAETFLAVERDDKAIARYVARRLTVARAQDERLAGVSGAMVADAARRVAARNRHFLFARLAVYELIARPELLAGDRHDDLDALLNGDHSDLFAAAVARLESWSAQSSALLWALALARGRGVPIRDGIWATMASALHQGPAAINDGDISELLARAQPYIAIDTQQDNTVYRLAHRTFLEFFRSAWSTA